MLSRSILSFIRDETGGYTVWSLIWFSLYVAMGGLAVDVTDAYRTRTQLQATADAAALAGVMSLPDTADAVSQAVAYAEGNMAVSVNGHVVRPAEVYTGNWDKNTEQFTIDGSPLNAVRVVARRADTNSNPLATNFLRILSIWGLPFDRWNINVDAVAIQFVPECLTRNGLVANNQVDVTSGGTFNDICIHGQNEIRDPGHDYAVDLNNGNTYGEDVQVSMSDLNGLNGKTNLCDQNPGLCDPGTLKEGDMWATDTDYVNEIIAGLTEPDSTYMPDYMFDLTGASPEVMSGDGYDENYAGPFLPYHVYDINCSSPNKIFSLPDVVLDKVVIVADCQIHSSSNGVMISGVLATSAVGNGTKPLDQNSIDFASGWTFGSVDFCTGGPGVAIYTSASASIVADTTVYGMRAVVGGNFNLTADGDIAGISVEAADSISATANGDYTFCGGTFDDENYAWHYRLVR